MTENKKTQTAQSQPVEHIACLSGVCSAEQKVREANFQQYGITLISRI